MDSLQLRRTCIDVRRPLGMQYPPSMKTHSHISVRASLHGLAGIGKEHPPLQHTLALSLPAQEHAISCLVCCAHTKQFVSKQCNNLACETRALLSSSQRQSILSASETHHAHQTCRPRGHIACTPSTSPPFPKGARAGSWELQKCKVGPPTFCPSPPLQVHV